MCIKCVFSLNLSVFDELNRFISLEKVSPLSIYTHILYMHSRKQHTLYLYESYIRLSVKVLHLKQTESVRGSRRQDLKCLAAQEFHIKKKRSVRPPGDEMT